MYLNFLHHMLSLIDCLAFCFFQLYSLKKQTIKRYVSRKNNCQTWEVVHGSSLAFSVLSVLVYSFDLPFVRRVDSLPKLSNIWKPTSKKQVSSYTRVEVSVRRMLESAPRAHWKDIFNALRLRVTFIIKLY